jgi:hypothetical protein
MHSEVPEAFQVGSNIMRLTIPGELVRIYFNIDHDFALLSALQSAVRMNLEPFIIGVGQVSVRETPEGVVIFRADNRKRDLVHNESPELVGTSQASAAGGAL